MFTAQYSEAAGKSKASTDELRRVNNIVKQIVEGIDKELRNAGKPLIHTGMQRK
jgi:hypothetical protein